MKYLVLGSVLASLAALESDALACGGCFSPPETPTVVTDHHMIFSISKDQSTLYDQIQYTGSPASFAWVLPYAGEITIGVSSDVLFRTLDQTTQTQILPPPRNCPPYPSTCPEYPVANASAGGPSAATDAGAAVTVLARQVVGPYETVQLAASSPTALNDWLTSHGYALPDSVKPTVAAYQAEHFNFLALKLVPGKDVQDMQPIRVTTKGSNVALPLRMIAAGAGATVGITLWVIAEGRYDPSNFGQFTITSNDISWDWTNNKSNYIDVRAQRNAAGGGKVWEIESASTADRSTLSQYVQNGGIGFFGGVPATVDGGVDRAGYLPVYDGQGKVTKTSDEARTDDFATLFAGIAQGNERVTRIRADLAHEALTEDLTLKAAADQSALNPVRQVVNELNEPQCPVYNNCTVTGTAPRSQAAAMTAANPNSSFPADAGTSGGALGTDDGCQTTGTSNLSTWAFIGLGTLGVALSRRRKKARG